ncbi:MAG: putative DNA binding domain-containing protein, partial [Chloroflexi bacterium]|nr:putative DNA binding domain-containing protein [Chloroflexota bacterium]
YWWVYKKEPNAKELQAKATKALGSLQLLKDSANRLDPSEIQTYADLVALLSKFMDAHQEPIAKLYDFVACLHGKDPLAPAILFSYRVWGSTRRSDRWLELNSTDINTESDEVIHGLTEIACGLANCDRYTLRSVEWDIGADLYDSDPEHFQSHEIPESRVVSRTARKVLDEFTEFFEQLRDSLRNIVLDTEKYLAEKNLLKSESFWRKFIMKSKAPGRIEAVLWDFKESLEMWHVSGDQRTKAQVEFCKLVAAFANNEGGAVIIGVTNKTRDIVGVPDLENRIKSVSDVINKWLDYPGKDAVIHLQPVLFEENGKPPCLVIAIAQAADVVKVRGVLGEYFYPDRDQTGVTNATPDELESRKGHLKAGDNFGFIKELEEFLHDR